MRHKWFALLAASALFIIACDAATLVSQFLPRQELEQAQATIEAIATSAPAMLTNVAPTLSAAQGQVMPTLQALGTQTAPTLAAAQTRVATSVAGLGTQATATPPAATTKGASAGTGNPFNDALAKANTATKFRVQVSWVFGGMENGKYVEQPFIDFSGEIDGAKAHLTSKGGLLAMLSTDANTPIEFVEADGKTYMKGVSMFGLTDPKSWYITDNSSTSGFADMAKPDSYKDWVNSANAGDFKKVRTERVDNQNCDVYLYDLKSLKNSELSSLLALGKDQADFGVVDKSEMNFWLCGDGFVHQFALEYSGHNQKDATRKAAMKLTWHASDFNNAGISVAVPKDAKAMPGSKPVN